MKTWVLQNKFGIENLRITSKAVPSPGPREVLLEMSAWSLNYRDHLMINGQYNPKQPLPLVPLSDGVGKVIEVGKEVTRAGLGDRVCPIFAANWLTGPPSKETLRSSLGGPRDGVLQEKVVVNEDAMVVVPAHLSDTEAATLPCAAVTAWSALEEARVSPGDTVLIEGTGGVAIFALQLALLREAKAMITSSSDDKLGRAQTMGAAGTINYRRDPDWGKAVRAMTGGEGVDCVIEVGGALTLREAIRATKPGGTIAVIGILGGSEAPLDVTPILMRQLRLQGILVGSRDRFEALVRTLETHRSHPVVDRVFGFDEFPESLRYLVQGKHFGKVCIERN